MCHIKLQIISLIKLKIIQILYQETLIALSFLLLQQGAVQSSILFLSRTVNRISQTSLVVKKSTPQPASIWKSLLFQIDLSYGWKCLPQVMNVRDHLLFRTGCFEALDFLRSGEQCEDDEVLTVRWRWRGGDWRAGRDAGARERLLWWKRLRQQVCWGGGVWSRERL